LRPLTIGLPSQSQRPSTTGGSPPSPKGENAAPVKHIASKVDEHDRRRAERDATRR
jgi:hypothetical protein